MNKPFAESCEQNRQPILQVIAPLLNDRRAVLEVGSGTGQHAVFFAEQMPHLVWHTSDREPQHAGIQAWLEEAGLDNTRPPLLLEVTQPEWPELAVDAVFTANTCHIMHWHQVEALFAGVGELLPAAGLFLVYGPFNYHGSYTSESNRAFDGWLKGQDPGMGIRDFAALERLAEAAGMCLLHDYAMPANNRILCWQRDPGLRAGPNPS